MAYDYYAVAETLSIIMDLILLIVSMGNALAGRVLLPEQQQISSCGGIGQFAVR
jgi:hypothetical protein